MLDTRGDHQDIPTKVTAFLKEAANRVLSGSLRNPIKQSTVTRELLLQAFRNVKPMLLVNMAAAICAAIVLAKHNPLFSYTWLTVMTLLTVLRGTGLMIFRKKLEVTEFSSPDYLIVRKNAELIYGTGLLTAAFMWNGLLYTSLRTADEAAFVATVIISALAGGAMGVSAPLKREGRIYISALLIPAAVILATAPEPHVLLGLLSFIFWFVMIYGHTNNFNTLRNAYQLQLENQTLVEDLQSLNTSLERKVVERTQELERAALRDPLTDLPNRRGFHEMLQLQISRVKDTEHKVAVGVIDLDGFKPVNDAFGHATGDELLIQVSQRLEDCLCEEHYIARLGGDEFGFIIPRPQTLQQLEDIGHRICEELARPFKLVGVVAEIGASVGMATYPDDTLDAEELCEKADYALYHAKQSNKGSAIVFDSNHEAEIRDLARMEQVLKQANFEDELYVVYQPVKNAVTCRTYGFEALARWKSPVIGDVPPGLFIRTAERSGQILQLTRHLLKSTLRGAQSIPEDMRISINLSARDIASMDAVDEIVRIVKESDVNANRIIFEITETALVCDFDQAKAALHELHRLGALIALDDFGTGHSSLSHLRLLPIDILKIDSSFISDIMTNPTSEDIVRTLIRLCDNMRIGCVVEGIETHDQHKKVLGLGGRVVQGYYFARPMPLTDIAAHMLSDTRAGIGADHHIGEDIFKRHV